MSQPEPTPLRQRAFGAILGNALKSPQFLFTVAFTLALYFVVGDATFIPGWQNWFWLVGGGLAATGFLVSSLTDPEAAQQAVNKMFEENLNLDRIKNRVARQHVEKALEYRTQMLELAQRAKGALRVNLLQTVDDVNRWIQGMVDLSLHLDQYADNQLVARDIKEVPQRIGKVKQRIELEARKPNSEAVVTELQRQLDALQQQLENLQAATTNAKRAEIQLETALASLGTMYSQMSRLGTSEVDSSKMQRLRSDIHEEVSSLQDLIHAMDEVQSSGQAEIVEAEARRMRLS
ncbi:MAG: hypothetical protein MUC99_12635 [Anaerolineae bacterium]|jgi:chromosome segregation ATPase|nr:hypothetical protein [Anaerolineae bacterium]